jgi:bile acid:Na+ symporter, BASS family
MQTIDILVSTVLGLIMFGVGLSLTVEKFTNIIKHPKAFSLALASQMIALPLIAFFVATVANVSNETKVGLVILAASPGGSTSGFITHLFKVDVALSISLTAINSFLTLFSIPFVVNIALQHFMGQNTNIVLPFWDTFVHIFFIALIPAGLGVAVHHRFPVWANRVKNPTKWVMIILLAISFTIKMFAGKSSGGSGITLAQSLTIIPSALTLNIACLIFGYLFLKIFGFSHSTNLTASIESGVHNTTLAFLIAGTLLQNQEMVKPPLVYAMFSFWTALLWGFISSKIAKHNINFFNP